MSTWWSKWILSWLYHLGIRVRLQKASFTLISRTTTWASVLLTREAFSGGEEREDRAIRSVGGLNNGPAKMSMS